MGICGTYERSFEVSLPAPCKAINIFAWSWSSGKVLDTWLLASSLSTGDRVVCGGCGTRPFRRRSLMKWFRLPFAMVDIGEGPTPSAKIWSVYVKKVKYILFQPMTQGGKDPTSSWGEPLWHYHRNSACSIEGVPRIMAPRYLSYPPSPLQFYPTFWIRIFIYMQIKIFIKHKLKYLKFSMC